VTLTAKAALSRDHLKLATPPDTVAALAVV
jgi:hypothetical protein